MFRRTPRTWWRNRRFVSSHKRRIAAFPEDIRVAHGHSNNHRAEVEASQLCGCFYCCAIYPPAEIMDWIDEPDEQGQTALCARCGIDSVIGDRAGVPITSEFLGQMNQYWF